MDQGTVPIRKKNPRESASIFSVITFFYTLVLFKKGRKGNLDDDDVYEVLPNFSSKKLGDKLEQYWNSEEEKQKKPSVLRAMIKCFGPAYILLGIVQLCVKTTLIFIQPQAMGKLVGYFKPGQKEISRSDVYMYAGLVVGLNIFSVIYNHNYIQFVIEFGIRVRTAFAALIYRKALKLNPTAFSDVTMGKIVTLITKDVFAFESALTFVNDMWIGLVQTILISYIIYSRIGLSVLSGVGFFILIIPLQLYVGKKTSFLRLAAAKKTDERLQVTTETLSAIKIIKMYTWENIFGQKINDARNSEIKHLSGVFYLKSLVMIIGGLVSSISFYILIMTYIWTGHNIDAEIVYFIQSCFFSLRSYITISIPLGIAQSADLYASINRIQAVLGATELKKAPPSKVASDPRVFLKNVSVKIKDQDVLQDVSLDVSKGLCLITGNVGSGKSSLLKTILHDYPISQGIMKVEGTISYTSQEPWLFPSTIKQNILFGQPYNEKRYQEVLDVCALRLDLSNFENGDQTVVGDKGINLSKGQQARISLARAVYKDSDLYLLDDCLSALDTHVNKYVFKHCIQGFLQNKLVILVTHNINHIKQVYGKNVLFVENGKTLSLEKQKDTLDKRITYYMDDVDFDYYEAEKEDKIHVEANNDGDEDCENTKLLGNREVKQAARNLYYEDKQTGKVSLGVYLRYYKFAGGLFTLILLTVVFAAGQFAVAFSEKLVSNWVNVEAQLSNYTITNYTNATVIEQTQESRNTILNLYSISMLAGATLSFIRAYLNFYFCLQASKNLHNWISHSVLNCHMTFFDGHYIGNIINRFSKDLGTTDEYIPFIIFQNFLGILGFFGIMYLIASVNYLFLIPAAFLLLKLYFVRRYYLPTGRSIKRLESATRSPMVGYLNATLEGLSTVRAYEKQTLFKNQFDRHQDVYTSSYFMMQCTIRAFGFSVDIICAFFITSIVGKFLFFNQGTEAGDVGLALQQAMMLTGLLQWTIRQMSELENNMTAVERVLEYADIKIEDKKAGQVLKSWPSMGRIQYKDVSLTYRTTNEQVLREINFIVEPKMKVGIVGRTGAGKSSIISSLFRLYDVEGQIFIDDTDIKTVSLDCLRSNIAIIPQDPILFSGTIRNNIDPIGKYPDEDIWKAIEKVNLKHIFGSLEQVINESGSNYSLGQKQLICLARALVSKSRIIVLDEATASMDPETCALLQRTIKDNFDDCTVLTIAHRLNTVYNSDKVMVVDAGRVLEFDSPENLLSKSNGVFYKMIRQAGLLQ